MSESIGGRPRDTTGHAHEARDLDARADRLSTVALRPQVDHAWARSGGQDQLSIERWVALWRRCGYLLNGSPLPRPAEPVRLYRGGRDGEGRMSWTSSREVAARYAASTIGRGQRRPVWTTLAPPDALLGQRTGDAEFVVDPALLDAVERDNADPFHEQGAEEVRGFRLTLGSAPTNIDRLFAGQRMQQREVTTSVNPLPWSRPAATRPSIWSSPNAPRRASWRDW